jgi:hypothetical protein
VPTIGSSLLNLMGMPQFAQDNDSEKGCGLLELHYEL